MSGTMKISQLAERTGVPTTTLRYYESAGLLPAGRTASGYRVYGDDAVERLAFIGAAKHLGLPLEEIAELLTVWESGACAEVKADLRPRVAARLRSAERRVTELDAFAASLGRALDHLDALPDRPGRCDPECGFLSPAASSASSVPAPLPPAPTHVPDVGPVAVGSAPRAAARGQAERWRTTPIACSLPADGLPARTDAWRDAVQGGVRTAIPDGLRLTLPIERAATIAELAADEQRCCPFFDFRLHLDGPELGLEVRAPEGATRLLVDLFGEPPAD